MGCKLTTSSYLTAGKNYEVSFKAKSDRSRSLIVGIGMNEEPYTNSSSTVDLSSSWQTFTKTLSASGFGGSNSRVILRWVGMRDRSIWMMFLCRIVTTTCDGNLNNGDFNKAKIAGLEMLQM